MHIDAKIESQLNSSPNANLEVVISFDKTSGIIQQLQETGFHINNKNQIPFGLISGSLNSDCLQRLKKIPEIESIELDGENYAL